MRDDKEDLDLNLERYFLFLVKCFIFFSEVGLTVIDSIIELVIFLDIIYV